jgi:hypothetical protein
VVSPGTWQAVMAKAVRARAIAPPFIPRPLFVPRVEWRLRKIFMK